MVVRSGSDRGIQIVLLRGKAKSQRAAFCLLYLHTIRVAIEEARVRTLFAGTPVVVNVTGNCVPVTWEAMGGKVAWEVASPCVTEMACA